MSNLIIKHSLWLSMNAGGGLGPPTRLEIDRRALAGRGFPPPPNDGDLVLRSMDPRL